jgi:hypothetical protein
MLYRALSMFNPSPRYKMSNQASMNS